MCFIIALTVILIRSDYYGGAEGARGEAAVAEHVQEMVRDLATRFEYADDAGLCSDDAASASARVSRLCECALRDADMEVSAPKTKCMHVEKQQQLSPVREEEYAALKLKHRCKFCRRFESDKIDGLHQHHRSCGARRREVFVRSQ